MSIILPKEKKKEQSAVHYQNRTSKNLLIIFTRNPELGKCKTRLAATVGDQNALDIYKYLLKHTATLARDVSAAKQVWYSEEIWENDVWDNSIFEKKLQKGADLGIRMAHAFQYGFASGFKRIIIIGSDMYDLHTADIDKAFSKLNNNEFVIGPAEDGGYYLLGMNTFNEAIFRNKSWGTETVLEETLIELKNKNLHLLETRNDVDVYGDIAEVKVFQPFLNSL